MHRPIWSLNRSVRNETFATFFSKRKQNSDRLGVLVKSTLVPSSRQIQGPELQIHAFYYFDRDWKENTEDTLLGIQPCEHMTYLILFIGV